VIVGRDDWVTNPQHLSGAKKATRRIGCPRRPREVVTVSGKYKTGPQNVTEGLRG